MMSIFVPGKYEEIWRNLEINWFLLVDFPGKFFEIGKWKRLGTSENGKYSFGKPQVHC